MTQSQVENKDEPIRLFKSDFLEFFTHISPIAVLVIWVPVVAYFIYRGIAIQRASAGTMIFGILLGLFLWTFAEYTLHRFLFHFKPRNAWQERLSFLMHGVHHAQPRDKTRLVMPPAVSIPLALVFLGLFHLIFNSLLMIPNWTAPVFAGFLMGYIAYDMIHYGTHHFPIKKGYFRMIRRNHMHHHFQTPDKRFGVSNPLWDYVFNTMPAEK